MKALVAVIMVLTVLAASLSAAAEGSDTATPLRLDLQDSQLRLEAHAVPLGEVIDTIEEQLALQWEGMQAARDQRIVFSANAASPEILVKKLLRYLGIKNFACEYVDSRLVKVRTFPQAIGLSNLAHQPISSSNTRPIRVIEIVDVIEETQAEGLGLQAGDIILKYDGVRIDTYDDLIEESTKDHDARLVQMILLRKGELISLFLEGGYIGVRVRAKRVSKDAIPPDLEGR